MKRRERDNKKREPWTPACDLLTQRESERERARERASCHKLTDTQQLLCRNVKRFRGRLVFEAHKLSYHLTLGSRVMKKKKKNSTS